MRSTIRIIATLILLSAGQTYAQYFGPVPFLNYPVSAKSLGMGGVGTATVSENAAATLDNPAQLGIFSFHGLFNANTDFNNSLGPRFYYPTNSFDLNSVNVGIPLNRIWISLPFKASAGLGYSNITSSSYPILTGAPFYSENTSNTSNALSVGIGLDYVVKVGLGFSFKWIAFHDIFSGALTKRTADDFGALVRVPLSKLVSASPKEKAARDRVIEPVYNLSLGYTMRNHGKYVNSYETLPTEADLGWSIDAGLKSEVAGQRWEWLSISWSDQAGVYPVHTDSTIGSISGADTTYVYVNRYQKGLGHFGIWQNLVVGRGSRRVGIRKGGQIGLGEFLYIRAGSITDAGQSTYTTLGWGLRLDGLAKCLVFLDWINAQSPVTKFLLDHLDLQYDYSRAYGGIYQGKPFEDLNLVVR